MKMNRFTENLLYSRNNKLNKVYNFLRKTSIYMVTTIRSSHASSISYVTSFLYKYDATTIP